jgi:hypothetical protein
MVVEDSNWAAGAGILPALNSVGVENHSQTGGNIRIRDCCDQFFVANYMATRMKKICGSSSVRRHCVYEVTVVGSAGRDQRIAGAN